MKKKVLIPGLLSALLMVALVAFAASLTEISLGSTSAGGGAGGLTPDSGTVVDGTTPTASARSSPGPEAVAFDGTYIWIAQKYANTVTRVRAANGTVAGTFAVGTRPVALAYDGT